MKKLISIILLCATAVLLCACGSAAPDKSSSGGSAVPPMQTASGSDTQAAADAPEEKAAENEQKIIAESYIGKEVSELYDAMASRIRSATLPVALAAARTASLCTTASRCIHIRKATPR